MRKQKAVYFRMEIMQVTHSKGCVQTSNIVPSLPIIRIKLNSTSKSIQSLLNISSL